MCGPSPRPGSRPVVMPPPVRVRVLLALLALMAPGCGAQPAGVPDRPDRADRAESGRGNATAVETEPENDVDSEDDSEDDSDQLEPGKKGSEDHQRIAAIEKAVNDTRAARHECWAFAAADDFRLAGRIVLRFTFSAPDAASVEVVHDQPGDARLSECLVQLYQAYAWPRVFEPGQAILLPFEFQAPDAQYTVAARYVEPAVLAEGKLEVAVLIDEKNSGNGAGALSTLVLSGGMEVPLHRHSATEILYVKSGQGLVYGLGGRNKAVRVGPGHGIYIPAGTAHAFVHQGDEPIKLVQLYTPAGPEKRFKGGPDVGTTPVSEAEARRPARDHPVPIVVKKPSEHTIAGGDARVAIYFEQSVTGDKAASMSVFTARPGARVPPHRHAAESEILLVLRGAGVMTVLGESYPIEPMTAVQVPANIEHSFDVIGEEPVEAIQFYTPAGPEQRFKGSK
jgi:quercetin dioxygenase-like cupin family protein